VTVFYHDERAKLILSMGSFSNTQKQPLQIVLLNQKYRWSKRYKFYLLVF